MVRSCVCLGETLSSGTWIDLLKKVNARLEGNGKTPISLPEGSFSAHVLLDRAAKNGTVTDVGERSKEAAPATEPPVRTEGEAETE